MKLHPKRSYFEDLLTCPHNDTRVRIINQSSSDISLIDLENQKKGRCN